MRLIDRIADRVDLAVDLLTLGQYGLQWDESSSVPEAGCEGGARYRGRREAPPPARGPGCDAHGRGVRPQPAG